MIGRRPPLSACEAVMALVLLIVMAVVFVAGLVALAGVLA